MKSMLRDSPTVVPYIRASVIVVTYNSITYLAPCLESILSQLSSADELIVVDNGSSDGSADVVAEQYPHACLFRAENTGYAGGNNFGAAQARGEYFVILNPDTVLALGALKALLAPLQEQTDIALTTPCIVHRDRPDIINTCGNTMQYTGLTYCRGAGRSRHEYAESAEVDAVSGAAFAIRSSVFKELGGFDETFFMYVEDSDLSWRARLAGYRCFYVANALVMHDYQPTYSQAKSFYVDRNRHLMLLKNLRRVTYMWMLPALLLSEIVTWGFLLLQGSRYWMIKPRVYYWLWTHRAAILATHRQASALHRRNDQTVVRQMTYRLEFGQLTNQALAALASAIFDPAFWAVRWLVIRESGLHSYPEQ